MKDAQKDVGFLALSLKKKEILIISDGINTIEILLYDKHKQPISARVRIKTEKQYDIRRKLTDDGRFE